MGAGDSVWCTAANGQYVCCKVVGKALIKAMQILPILRLIRG